VEVNVKLTRSKEAIVSKAEELAAEHESKYGGCAECTFMAVADALRWGGAEIVTPPVEDSLFPGIRLLSGGVGVSGQGTCGAVSGSIMAIGLALAALRGSGPRDMSTFGEGVELAQREILDAFDARYRSQRCLDIQMKRFGKAWDFRNPAMSEEFLGVTDGCAIRETARLAAAAICDAIEQQ
jgi:hypothetical protein